VTPCAACQDGGFDAAETEKCKEIYLKFDTSKKGHLNRDQFLQFQRTLRTETSLEEAYSEFTKWCAPGKTTLSMAELGMNLQNKLRNVPKEKRALVLDILITATPEDIIQKVEVRRSQLVAAKLEEISPEKKMERMHLQAWGSTEHPDTAAVTALRTAQT